MAHCDEGLKQISEAIKAWQKEHQGEYPDSLETLVEAGVITLWELVCPASDYGPGENAYAWRGSGMRDEHPWELMLVYCKQPRHKGRRNIMLKNGRVERLPERVFESMIKNDNELRRGLGLRELDVEKE